MLGVKLLENDIKTLKRKFDNIFNEDDVYCCLQNGANYVLKLKKSKNLTSEFCYNIAYYCEDFFIKGMSLENNESRSYYCDFFGEMGVFFCNKYVNSVGNKVFNDEMSVDFLIEMTMFYELADKHDEKLDLLEMIVNNSSNDNLKIRALNQILKIGGLNKKIYDKYNNLKNHLIDKK